MPFIDPAIILYLQNYTYSDNYDVIVPEFNGFIEPLFAFYSRKCIPTILDHINQKNYKIRSFYSHAKVKEVPCSHFESVVKETPLTIFVNEEELVTLLCLPQYQQNLAVGYLFSEGILSSKSEIESLIFNENRGAVWIKLNKPFTIDDEFRKGRTVTTGCARGLTFHQVFEKWSGDFVVSKLTIDHHMVVGVVLGLRKRSLLFQETSGTHSALLYQNDKFLLE